MPIPDGKFCQTFKEDIILLLYKVFQKKEEEAAK